MSRLENVIKSSFVRVFPGINRRLVDFAISIDDINELLRNQAIAIHSQQDQVMKLTERFNSSGYVQFSENEVLTKIFSGAKMYLDPRDVGLVPHLVLDGDWERNITQIWLKTIKKGDVVIDIGANYGYYGVLAAQQANRDCEVYLFEANPDIIPYLKKTMKVNSFETCSVVENLAVSDSQADVVLNILKGFIASSSIHTVNELNKYADGKAHYELESSVRVPAVTLDDYCKRKNIKSVDLIKMDIEGYEEKAYQGMRKIIKSSPKITLFIEFTKEGYKHPEQFYETLLEDFGNVYIIDQNNNLIRPKNNSYDAIIANSKDWVMPIFSKNKKLADKLKKKT